MTEPQARHEASAMADQPMQIVSTSYDADVVTVTWKAVTYKDCEGYVISVGTIGSKLENFQIDNAKATSDEVDFTCVAGIDYEVLVAPIIRGRPKDSLSSPPVPIPYPA